MTPSIFGKPLDDLTYDDIVEFCDQQIAESEVLDYKAGFSNMEKITKTLVAMANTSGGYVLIGVDDKDDKPNLPVSGIDAAKYKDYRARIVASIAAKVSPITMPDIHGYLDEMGKKLFVVGYVPQSSAGPHAIEINNKKKVLVRIHDSSRGYDEDEAEPEKYEFIRNRRAKSIELASALDSEIGNLLSSCDINYRPRNSSMLEPSRLYSEALGCLRVGVSPCFPEKQALTPRRIVAYMTDPQNQLTHGLVSSRNLSTPSLDYDDVIVSTFQNGAYVYRFHEELEGNYFFALDVYGGVFNCVPVEQRELTSNNDSKLYVEFTDYISVIERTLTYASTYQTIAGINGIFKLRVEFVGRDGASYLRQPAEWQGVRAGYRPCNVTGDFSYDMDVSSFDIQNVQSRTVIAESVARSVLAAYNYNYNDDEQLRKIVEKSIT